MSTVVTFPAASPSPSSIRETVVMKALALWNTIKVASRRRNAVGHLQMLDARTLADIGMSRSEIKSIVYCGSAERRVSYEND